MLVNDNNITDWKNIQSKLSPPPRAVDLLLNNDEFKRIPFVKAGVVVL